MSSQTFVAFAPVVACAILVVTGPAAPMFVRLTKPMMGYLVVAVFGVVALLSIVVDLANRRKPSGRDKPD